MKPISQYLAKIPFMKNMPYSNKWLPQAIQKKSDYYPSLGGESLYNRLLFQGWNILSSYVAIQYYQQCAPLADAVDTISREIKAIQPIIYDRRREKFIYNHPLLDLLKYPNADITYKEYIEKTINYYLITGNNYVVTLGDVRRPPLETFSVPPQAVTLVMGQDGYTTVIQITNQYMTREFVRHEVNGRFKFYDRDGDAEIYHMRTFNPYYGINMNYGIAPLAAIYYQVEQYIAAAKHNLSLLTLGAKTTGAFVSKNNLSDDQYQRLQEQINVMYSGSGNTGRPMLLDGDMSFAEMGLTMRDMDFAALEKSTRETIYNRFKIPLAFTSSETLKFNNLEASREVLYDQAIIPTAKLVFEELTNLFMYRYPGAEHLELTFDMDDIAALQDRRISEMLKLKETGCYTINELRALRGDDRLEGGDVILGNLNEIPVAKDPSVDVYLHPADDESQYAAKVQKPPLKTRKETRREEFIRIMREKKDNMGNKKYSDDDIRDMANRNGL